MSWLSAFEDELTARGVRRSARERLVAELADHLECERDLSTRLELTQLGEAREIACQCADELAADDARRGALHAFGALALTAVALVVSQATLGGIGYPGFDHGFTAALSLPAILALVVGAQVALVSGTLAAWRALRRRREPVLPGAEVALVNRRARVGLAGGLAVCASMALYAVDFATVLPVWWLALSGGLAILAGGALVAAWRRVSLGASTVALAGGPAGDIYDDLPPLRALRGHPWRLWMGATLLCGGAMTLFEWHAERSLAEGLQRGVAEAVLFSICFAALARAVGARSGASSAGPSDRPAGASRDSSARG
jgi:hypothetical protein